MWEPVPFSPPPQAYVFARLKLESWDLLRRRCVVDVPIPEEGTEHVGVGVDLFVRFLSDLQLLFSLSLQVLHPFVLLVEGGTHVVQVFLSFPKSVRVAC